MSLVINTNTAATSAANSLNSSNAMFKNSLARLSSGSKIVNPSDDAGGLAVSMKLSSAINRTNKVNENIQNAVSFLQTQDGALKTATKILDRVSELKTMYEDVTKSSSDKANYDSEFTELVAQLQNLDDEQFNGVNLFAAADGALTVATTETGSGDVTVSQADFNQTGSSVATITAQTSLANVTVTNTTDAIQEVATQRAVNGAQQSRLQFASETLNTNKVNLEAANSRIIDTDIASESTAFARYNILVQSGSAMLAQANSSQQVALRLIG
ncbi:MAG: flagellin [Opitutales bacterium]